MQENKRNKEAFLNSRDHSTPLHSNKPNRITSFLFLGHPNNETDDRTEISPNFQNPIFFQTKSDLYLPTTESLDKKKNNTSTPYF